MKNKLITLSLLLLFLIAGCSEIKDENTSQYQHGYEVGLEEGYTNGRNAGYEEGYNAAQSEALQYVQENYSINEVYDSGEIKDYAADNYDPAQLYNEDTLIEAVENADYAVITIDDYYKYIEYVPTQETAKATTKETSEVIPEVPAETSTETAENTASYIGNKNTKKFHRASCSSVNDMKDSNKVYESREYLIEHGYKPCKKCNP